MMTDADQLAADHDMSPEQGRQMRQHNVLSDAGLDANRLAAVRWAVEHGRIGEDDKPSESMIQRAIRIAQERGR